MGSAPLEQRFSFRPHHPNPTSLTVCYFISENKPFPVQVSLSYKMFPQQPAGGAQLVLEEATCTEQQSGRVCDGQMQVNQSQTNNKSLLFKKCGSHNLSTCSGQAAPCSTAGLRFSQTLLQKFWFLPGLLATHLTVLSNREWRPGAGNHTSRAAPCTLKESSCLWYCMFKRRVVTLSPLVFKPSMWLQVAF